MSTSRDIPEPDVKPIVFLHVMKCGGTSVRAALADVARADRPSSAVFELDGRASKTAVGGPLVDDWDFRDALLPYALLALRPAVVMGHFRHRDRYAELLSAAHFVSVLRDPVERIVSLYRYRRHASGVDLPQRRSLDELLATGRWALEGHRYVSTFCGRDDLDPRSGAAIDAAVNNLQRYSAVGRLDHLEGFGAQLGVLVGRPITMPRLNASPLPAAPGDDIDPATREELASLCEPDRRVYDAIFEGSS